MTDELESRVQRIFLHVAPSPSADVDLAGALATAVQSPAPGTRRSLWIGVTTAAAIIAAVGLVVERRESGGGHEPRKVVAAPLDGRTVRVHVAADGIVVLDDLRGAPLVTVELGGTPTRASDGLDVLERAIVELTAREPRASNASSTLALEFEPSADAKWIWEQWIMQVATRPSVRIDRIRFGMEGSGVPAIEQRLPSDRGTETDSGQRDDLAVLGVVLMASPQAEGTAPTEANGVRISVHWMGAGWNVKFNSSRTPGETDAVGLVHAMTELTALLQTAAADRRVVGHIRTPPPHGGDVPYKAVLSVLRAFLAAGIEGVEFEGTSNPKRDSDKPSR